MVSLRQLLDEMIKLRASDLHISAGVPPQVRIDGSITPMQHPPLTPNLHRLEFDGGRVQLLLAFGDVALWLPEVVARRSAAKGRLKAFAIEPEVTINNQWSNRYTVIEVMGLDRPGLLYELTATLSKLSLNITSAHVATFGERAVDVFYVTDLLGAKIASPTREMAIKRALLQLFAPPA